MSLVTWSIIPVLRAQLTKLHRCAVYKASIIDASRSTSLGIAIILTLSDLLSSPLNLLVDDPQLLATHQRREVMLPIGHLRRDIGAIFQFLAARR